MNSSNQELSEEQLDLLVDGELSESQQKDLLGRLEHEPGGWRRCALAFLESQCWKREIVSLRRAPEAERSSGPVLKMVASVRPVPSLPHASPSPAGWVRRHSPTAMAMAASFLVAMLAGWVAWPHLRPSNPVAPTGNEVARVDTPIVTPQQVVSQPEQVRRSLPSLPTGGAGIQTVVRQSGQIQPALPRLVAPREVNTSPWQMVTVSVPDGQQGTRPLHLPALQRDRVDENWVRSMPQAMPPEVLAALHRTGHQVTESRHLVPVSLEDGRRLVVPVDQVDVHYVGNKDYQ